MRGDGVGVGDIGAVPGGAWWSGYPTGGDDLERKLWQHVGGILSGGGGDERDAARERGRDGVGILGSWTQVLLQTNLQLSLALGLGRKMLALWLDLAIRVVSRSRVY